MSLTDEEREAIVAYRLEKAENALIEVKDCASLGHWTLSANRLYYVAYYAASALLINAGYYAKTHEGTIRLIAQHYGALLTKLQTMRHTGDYDDFLDWTKEEVEPYIPKVEAFVAKLKSIISNGH